MPERQAERLEPSLEREGAGGRLRSALPLATEGTQETLLTKKGLGLTLKPSMIEADESEAIDLEGRFIS